MDKSANPFFIMTQLQIEATNEKLSVIRTKIVEKESFLKQLISKDNKLKVTMRRVKEGLENIINNYGMCNLDEK